MLQRRLAGRHRALCCSLEAADDFNDFCNVVDIALVESIGGDFIARGLVRGYPKIRLGDDELQLHLLGHVLRHLALLREHNAVAEGGRDEI